jgi:hypothetical protein
MNSRPIGWMLAHLMQLTASSLAQRDKNADLKQFDPELEEAVHGDGPKRQTERRV